ncbi:MAG: gliding motility-associated C-terminal domain-containing protein [Saprospiraceae bacterium]|nr:gliding motility-associated C-terminal domain-containing protein [Saprospiraceae bacterium]
MTDNGTGCTSTEGPFTVTVNPVPTVTIASSPSGFICENTSATLNVTSPNATYNYQWNTGETGTSITVVAGGTYFATAINQFGCKGLSNEIDIHNAPDIDLVPQGCHTRCQPDTMCLPIVPDIASYQWLFNGSPMSAPNGTQANPIFNQSGEYSVVLTDIYGCTSTSEVLTLDLFPGFGDIVGDVYFDVNGNGIIDAPDTLVSGINIFLNNGVSNLDTVTSSVPTGYNFVDILASNYDLILDTLNLPPGWEAVLVSTTVNLSGCDVEEQFDWLLFANCAASTASVTLTACPGSSADYNGTPVPTGASQDFTLINYLGCDSVVTVTVNPLPTSTGAESFDACPGTSITYNGTSVAAGTNQDFTLTNWLGCDSVVTVTVNPLPTSTGAESFGLPRHFHHVQRHKRCRWHQPRFHADELVGLRLGGDSDGEPAVRTDLGGWAYGLPRQFCRLQRHDVAARQRYPVPLPKCARLRLGGDGDGAALPASTSTVNLAACPGATANYNGTDIPAGASQTFMLTNWLGCDSMVTVSVATLQPSTSTLNLTACPGTTAIYNGTPVAAGTSMDFMLANWQGCDSVVTVSVATLPAGILIIDGLACTGNFFNYNGNQVAAGTSQTFYEVNASGCTDTVIVAVMEVPTSASSLQLTACPGTTVTYGGMTLSAGDVQDFTLTNWLNCDSVVTVTVLAAQSDTTQLALQVCEGETTSYNGQSLSAGEQYTWVGTNQAGCDSVVFVSVTALPSVSYDLAASQICWNAVDGSIAIGNVSGSTGPYQFSLNGTAFQSDTLFAGLPPGDYTVAVQDVNACIFSENISIGAVPPIVAEAQDETLVCGETVMLQPVVVSSLPVLWQWSDSSGVVSTADRLQVSSPGVYIFTVTNDCESMTGNINVQAEPLAEARLIYLPNSFSPNDDGINDCYRGFVAPDLEIISYELKIFDRWGDLLFETEDIEGCWDGWFRGKEMDPAVMVYWLRMRVRNCDGLEEDLFRKGDVNLVR